MHWQPQVPHKQWYRNELYEGCSLISVICLITIIVSALCQCVLYQMKAGFLPKWLIPNTLIYYGRLYWSIVVLYSTLVSLTCFLSVKQYTFLTMCEGRAINVFPRYDKTNTMSVRPAKTHISLGVRPVWSESLLSAEWVAKDTSFLHADSEDSDHIG